MKVNVENIKVLNVNNNGKTVVFNNDDIIELEYNTVIIKGRLAKIEDHFLTVDCSELYFSNIHEVAIEEITWINKAGENVKEKLMESFEQKKEENVYKQSLSTNEIIDEVLALDQETSSANNEDTDGSGVFENNIAATEDENESVSLFGSIKRNYAQGISPILNR